MIIDLPEILETVNPRPWRATKDAAFVVVGIALYLHQPWAAASVRGGLQWFTHQEILRLQPMFDRLLKSIKLNSGAIPRRG